MPPDRLVSRADAPQAVPLHGGRVGLHRRWSRVGLVCLLGLGLLAGGGNRGGLTARAVACPACLGPIAPPLSLAQKVVNCRLAVRATPTDQPRRFRILASFKGEPPTESLIELAPADAPPLPARADHESLLGYETLARRWIWLGEIAPGHADWLARLAPLRRSADLTSSEWLQRAELFLDGLGSSEPLVAETAFRELVRTPYATMRELRPRLGEELLFKALDPERRPDRRALAALLLGVAGTPRAAEYVARELTPVLAAKAGNSTSATVDKPLPVADGGQPAANTTRQAAERPDLAALLTAHLELQGPAALPAVITHLVLSESATRGERQAALLACSIHGTASGPVSRDEVANLFVELLAHPRDLTRSLAPLLVPDLAAWSRWEAVPQVTRLRELTPADDPARLVYDRYLDAARQAPAAR